MSNRWKDKYPISEEIHNTTLSLPISYCHNQSDILIICDTINQFFENKTV
jgi:hypothetical protein